MSEYDKTRALAARLFDAIDVAPLGLRHHHYDHVHVGSHRESYSESYACGETCSTSAKRRTMLK